MISVYEVVLSVFSDASFNLTLYKFFFIEKSVT